MKKLIAYALVGICIISLTGCAAIQDSQGALSAYLVEEEGEVYLVLPKTGEKLRVDESHKPYLDSIDLELLKAAEEKIYSQMEEYQEEPFVSLELHEGYLCLYAEVIVYIDPPATTPDRSDGCGIDHEHKIFYERITK